MDCLRYLDQDQLVSQPDFPVLASFYSNEID
jgi:hypothetical protein